MEILKKTSLYDGFNNLSYPLIIIDEKNEILWINKKAKNLIDLSELKNQIELTSVNLNKKIVQINNVFYEMNLSSFSIDSNKYKSLSLFNISKRKKLEEKLSNSNKMFKLLSEQLPESILVCDEKIIYTNPAFEKMLGYSNKYFTDKSFSDLLDKENQTVLNESLEYLISNKKQKVEFLLSIKKSNGNEIWANVVSKVIYEDDKMIYINLIKDITSTKTEQEKLQRLANTDLLTNIYNRRKFQELFDREYKRSKRYGSELSLIFFDIDHFKKINDTYGHDIGDIVLKEVSSTVTKEIRETDIFARWGGEEFIILLPETNKERAYEVAENIRIVIAQQSFKEIGSVTISLGVTQLKNELQKSFIKRVDLALYKAKNNGRNKSIIL